VGANIVLTFSEPIQRGTGQIVLKTAYGAVEGVYEAATSANLNISGNTLTINPGSDLGAGRGYLLEFAPGSIKDLAGNAYAGTTAYNFTVQPAPAFAPARWSTSGHHYQWVSAPSATPAEALAQAQQASYRGLKGYLGTISSAAENQFVVDMMVPVRPYLGMSGGVIFGASDQAVDGQWKWLTGPEAGTALSYFNWSPTEPTVTFEGQREDFLYVMVGGANVTGSGWWADISSGRAPGTNGYLIEYGGLPASYAVSSSSSTVNEGGAVTFTIDTTNLEWGAALSYTLSGINQADLASGALTGTAVVQQRGADGRATVTVELAADQLTEGAETLTLTVGGVSSPVAVIDTSLTADTTAPTVTTFSPADEATGVAVGANIVLTFSEPIQRGTGQIVLKTAAGAVVATYDAATSANLSISGNTLTIDPSADLSFMTGYSVELAAGTVKDMAGNAYAGTSSYNFATHSAATALEATLSVSGDDRYEVYLNGVLIGRDNGDSWTTSETWNVLLQEGQNVLCVVGRNDANGTHPGAVIADLMASGLRIVTDTSWMVSTTASDGWLLPGFVESSWQPALGYGDLQSSTWWNRGPGNSYGVSIENSKFPSDSLAKWIWNAGFLTDSSVYMRKEF
jgi:methionine-rich copper-binding protein CopC